MALDSIENEQGKAQGAPEETGDVFSYALDALSELQSLDVASQWGEGGAGAADAAAALEAVPASPAVPAADFEPDTLASAERDARLERLQSTLDWYKDWLGSM